ncbi:MAG TPA: molybdopterin cofactor-binding domain-containing protein, partial [Terriglobales bacterium]|nr:molybdopterin cofactor-binding domain-containing protein [Terriglobales bacterium]
TPVPKIDGRAFVTGEHKYTYDMSVPGMMVGKVLRPPAFNATLTAFDSSEAEKIPGVVVTRDNNFAGVAAPDERTAMLAIRKLQAKWDAPPQPSEAQLFDYLRQNAAHGEPSGSGDGGRNAQHVKGDVAAASQSADKKLSQTYTIAYIAHCPLEPRAAVAEWQGDKVTVWTGSQRPFGIQQELSEAFRIPLENARVIIPDTGSAYGGKHTGDAAVEAARLAKAAGKPVKLNWTREEELTWAYFRPAGVIDVKSAAKSDGTLVAWEFDNYNSGASAIAPPYNIANQRVEFHTSKSPLRQGSYRGLAATANHFARESHMDEMAHELGMDPLEFRLKNISDPRLREVLTAAAEKFGWGKEKPTPERGFGLACGFEKGSWFGCCAEVAIERGGQVRVTRVAQAFDCGAVVNPNGLRNQVAGAVMQGVGGALFEAIHFDNGKILNPHFMDYRLPRFTDMPQIEVVLVDRKDQPSAGAGETPIMGIAPATGNAIFAAIGIRLKSLPMVPDGLKAKA